MKLGKCCGIQVIGLLGISQIFQGFIGSMSENNSYDKPFHYIDNTWCVKSPATQQFVLQFFLLTSRQSKA